MAHGVLGLGVLLFALPVWLVLAGSTQDAGAISRGELSLIPSLSGLHTYADVLLRPGREGAPPVWHMLLVSFGMALSIAFGKIVISVLSAFSLSRMGFWGSQTLATGVFLTYLVPASLLFIPLFQIVGALGLINNVYCLVLLFPTLAVPFCTWIMIGYFSSIPKELDEAALIDGASYPQILIRIFIPVALPGIIAATIFAFTISWGAFLYPLAYLYTGDQLTLTVGIISDLIRGDVFLWGKIMAACVLGALPPVIVYAFLMDYYIAGLTSGATKG